MRAKMFSTLLITNFISQTRTQFTNMEWTLGFMVCDMWIAADVIASTASILNLVAIAVDRYMAVRMPIKYAQQLRTRRIAITIFLVWTISFLIGIPIMAGFNTPPDGQVRPENDCAFYNADYILMSGFISFWVPTVLLFIIYWYVFSTLKRRSSAMRAKMHQNNTNTTATATNPSAATSAAAKVSSQPKALPQTTAPTATTKGLNKQQITSNNNITAITKPSATVTAAKPPSLTTTTTTTSSSSAATTASAVAAVAASPNAFVEVKEKPPDDRLDIIQHAHNTDLLAPCSPTVTTSNTTSSSSGQTTTTTTAHNTLMSNKSSTTSNSDFVLQQPQPMTDQNARPNSPSAPSKNTEFGFLPNAPVLVSNFQTSLHQRRKTSSVGPSRKPNIHLHSNVLPTSPVWVQRLDVFEQQLSKKFCDTVRQQQTAQQQNKKLAKSNKLPTDLVENY